MNINLIPGEKLLIKMWESLADKGIGSLLKPWQVRREGLALAEVKRQDLLLLAQAEREAEDIRKGVKVISGSGPTMRLISAASTQSEVLRDGRLEPTLNLEAVVKNAANFHAAKAIREEVNVARALLHAETSLAQDQSLAPEASLDDDWLYRWRANAASVSTEQMQALWGSLLAEEVKTPGRFSLRTLDFLRNLSPEEAHVIEAFSRFIFDSIMPKYGELEDDDNREGGITNLLLLQELGLLSGVGGLGLQLTFNGSGPTFVRSLIGRGKGMTIRHDDPAKKLELAVYRVTPLGRQVFALPNRNIDEEFFLATARACQSQGFTIILYDALPIPGTDKYRMVNQILLPEPSSTQPEQANNP